MARPFEIALEDAVVEENTQPELIDVSDVIEETAIAEEEAEESIEIDEQIEAIDEASEEADAMLDQSDVNEAKIEAAEQAVDAAGGEDTEAGQEAANSEVTEEDIIVSEENLKYSIIRFGCDDDLKHNLKLSMEARADKKSRLARLKLAQEGVSDFIVKVVSTIKTLISKVIANVKKFFAKLSLRFGGYQKKAVALIEKFNDKGDKVNLSDLAKSEIVSHMVKTGLAFMAYDTVDLGLKANKEGARGTTSVMVEFEKLAENYLKTFVNDAAGDKVDGKGLFAKFKAIGVKFRKNIAPTTIEKAEKTLVEELGGVSKDDLVVLGFIGNNIYYVLGNSDKGVVVKSFDVSKRVNVDEVSRQAIADFNTELDINKEVKGTLLGVIAEIKDAKSVFKAFDDTEAKYLKTLDSLKSQLKSDDAGANRRLKVGLDVIKVCATNINLFLVRNYIAKIKGSISNYNAILTAIEYQDKKDQYR